jgi:fucose 4-O-acetylase-like acetyltransferase
MRQRDENIDTARGIACVLLVAWHVIGESPATGLHVAQLSNWRFFADVFIYFRMPLFAFLSGYVYATRPFAGDAKRFLVGKAQRLLVPMFIVGNVFAFIQWLVLGVNSDNVAQNGATLHILPVAHYWFLGSLFVIFVVVAILESLRLLDHRWRFAMVLAAAVAIYLTMDPFYFADPFYFDLARTVYLFPYFLCGLACSRFSVERSGFIPVAIAILVGAWTYAAAGVFGFVPFTTRTSIVALLIGVSGSFVMLRSGWKNRSLAFIGVNSYSIFLFHVFFTAASRMIMNALHIKDIDILFVVGTLTGILFPILINKLAEWYAPTRIVRLGMEWSRSKLESRMGGSVPKIADCTSAVTDKVARLETAEAQTGHVSAVAEASNTPTIRRLTP